MRSPPFSFEEASRAIDELGYCAIGRRYGVSDKAVRKWVRFYERAGEVSGDVQPP